mmetsp:Transcript_24340/g.43884  ORF Transcript_24340/g.43884 Transcript_24340/m.43884 type:complete len:165 (-) Transcript_24340:272-766(-)|eukprot:CAMPEP_0201656188 /NCGR_PEP_ID=MMETSP0493-20130528/46397_1 /ASSEMBLY_ACC=CAM_ASM_000838 /TAXON_ID=420259 /ORGANISM="Thalassiosira gravida, Strain GMp14c1" /LENGTH=164 /DNA_ID=CAMNT_0048132797 /DNA_START=82 /DNA_END=576 /DNA_ORIENTATION=-
MPKTIEPTPVPTHHLPGDILKPQSAPALALHAAKGRNASGRTWKVRPQKRASSLVTKNSSNNRSKSWDAKQKVRMLNKEIKSAQADMRQARIEEKREKRERRLENERRKMENEYNHAKRSMQTLNSKRLGHTMRSMNKKQLRQIKKSRMNTKTGVVEFVGAYEK